MKLYLDIMNDSNKSKFYLYLNYPDSTSKSVRRLLKIWETSALQSKRQKQFYMHSNKSLFDIWQETS